MIVFAAVLVAAEGPKPAPSSAPRLIASTLKPIEGEPFEVWLVPRQGSLPYSGRIETSKSVVAWVPATSSCQDWDRRRQDFDARWPADAQLKLLCAEAEETGPFNIAVVVSESSDQPTRYDVVSVSVDVQDWWAPGPASLAVISALAGLAAGGLLSLWQGYEDHRREREKASDEVRKFLVRTFAAEHHDNLQRVNRYLRDVTARTIDPGSEISDRDPTFSLYFLAEAGLQTLESNTGISANLEGEEFSDYVKSVRELYHSIRAFNRSLERMRFPDVEEANAVKDKLTSREATE